MWLLSVGQAPSLRVSGEQRGGLVSLYGTAQLLRFMIVYITLVNQSYLARMLLPLLSAIWNQSVPLEHSRHTLADCVVILSPWPVVDGWRPKAFGQFFQSNPRCYYEEYEAGLGSMNL